jgi:hypothetical protein
MNDMSSTIVAKSDQINAADLVGISRTITIREVRIKANDDQPVSVFFEGDQKAFRPCKGVRRLMVRVWGADASKYIGQSMTLFQDPTVTWAGKPEGGIRVSHMTGIDEEIIEFMRTSREKTKPYKILPLQLDQRQTKPADPNAAEKWANDHLGFVAGAMDLERLAAIQESGRKAMDKLAGANPELHAKITAAYAARLDALSDADDPFTGDGVNAGGED